VLLNFILDGGVKCDNLVGEVKKNYEPVLYRLQLVRVLLSKLLLHPLHQIINVNLQHSVLPKPINYQFYLNTNYFKSNQNHIDTQLNNSIHYFSFIDCLQFLLLICSFFLVLHDLLQSQLYFLDGLSRSLMGVCRHIELEKSVWKLFENSEVCNALFLFTSLINHLLEFLDKSTTVVVERVFATHKNLCPWVLLQRLSFCPDGRHKCICLRIYAPIFQVSSQAYFKESMGEDHVIKGVE
jgi:hypothetical protein